MTSLCPVSKDISTKIAMPGRRVVLVSGVVGMSVLLSGCWLFPETVTRQIRVVAQAEIAGTVVEGSAVIGMRWVPGDQGRMYIKSNVDSIVLDLPGRGTVYVLNAWMAPPGMVNGGYWPLHVLRHFGMQANGHRDDFPTLRKLRGRYQVDPFEEGLKGLPVMVAFTDETRRETMFHVHPNRFADHFGADVRFVSLWFEFTQDEPTDILPQRLPVAIVPNESFYSAFPLRDANGDLIPLRDYAFPQKFPKSVFYDREY